MITTTLMRMSGKLVKNLGWWQFLVLCGACAWVTTPVDAQQGGYQPYNGAPASRGLMLDDGDDMPQPRGLGGMTPSNGGQWDDFSRPSAPQYRPTTPRLNNDPGGYPDPRMSPSGDDGGFQGSRRRRSNYRGMNFQGPEYSPPAPQIPRYQTPDLSQNLNQGYQELPMPGQGYQAPNNPNQSFPGQNFPSPNLPSQNVPGQNFQNPGFPGQTYPDPGYSTGNQPGFNQPLPGYSSPVPRSQPTAPGANLAQETQTRITRRYQNQSFLSLLSLPPQQCLALYSEVTQMIDNRHLEPSPLTERIQKGLTNLMSALDNPAFVQTNRLMLQQNSVMAYRQALQRALQSPLRSEQDALGVVSWTMQMSQQQIGLPPAATALEFVYGAVESLDKYSAFVPPEVSPGASLQLESSLVGIGVQIEMRDTGAEVVKVISGSPAQTAGLKQGDVLLAVSGKQLGGMDVDQTVSLISGPAGSQVVLGVQRQSQGVFTITATRQAIQLHSVNDVQLLNGTRVGYFKLDKFTATANEEVENALQQLYRQGMQSLVMDLRGNPGGLLTAAIQISDKFLPQGTIVATRGRNSSDNSEEHATKEHTWKIPLVVLVDHNSASASEIFAAAIQENHRGLVVGRTSYGKGTVQTQFPLQTAGCGLRITTARFYSPTGRVMAGSGVTPDVPVAENSGNANGAYGAYDQDIMAALNVAQSGGFNQNRYPNQNLSGLPGMQPSRVPQPFSQPQFNSLGR